MDVDYATLQPVTKINCPFKHFMSFFVDTFVSTRFRTKVVFLSFINCSKQLDCLDEIKFKRLLKGY